MSSARTTFSLSPRGFSLLQFWGERASKRGQNGFLQLLEVAEKHAQTFVAGVGSHDDFGRIEPAPISTRVLSPYSRPNGGTTPGSQLGKTSNNSSRVASRTRETASPRASLSRTRSIRAVDGKTANTKHSPALTSTAFATLRPGTWTHPRPLGRRRRGTVQQGLAPYTTTAEKIEGVHQVLTPQARNAI